MTRAIDHRGFTLLELLVTLAILSIGLLGTAGMIVQAMQSNNFSRKMTAAYVAAQDKLELKSRQAYSDLFQDDLLAACAAGSAPDGLMDDCSPADGVFDTILHDDGLNGDAAAGDTIFTQRDTPSSGITRTWTVQRDDASNLATIQVTATWTDKAGQGHSVTLTTLKAKES
ncbi:MAG: prepilin-type N-terminal cleavage/methylation domain-containing protein [Nitrospirota bacterium]